MCVYACVCVHVCVMFVCLYDVCVCVCVMCVCLCMYTPQHSHRKLCINCKRWSSLSFMEHNCLAYLLLAELPHRAGDGAFASKSACNIFPLQDACFTELNSFSLSTSSPYCCCSSQTALCCCQAFCLLCFFIHPVDHCLSSLHHSRCLL